MKIEDWKSTKNSSLMAGRHKAFHRACDADDNVKSYRDKYWMQIYKVVDDWFLRERKDPRERIYQKLSIRSFEGSRFLAEWQELEISWYHLP